VATWRWATVVGVVATGLVAMATGGAPVGAEDAPPPAELRVGDVLAWELQGLPGRALVPITLDRPLDHDVTVSLEAVSSSATPKCPGAGDGLCSLKGDYRLNNDSVLIPAGVVTRHVPIGIVADNLPEDRRRQVIANPPLQIVFEEFLLRATVDDPDVVAIDHEGVVQIRDSVPGITLNDVTVAEGDAGTRWAAVTLNLSPVSTESVTVTYRTKRGLAVPPGDFRGRQGVVTFAPGSSTAQVVVPIVPDADLELNEPFEVVLSDPVGAPLGDASSLIRILNDD
jgi:hypothetical protein